MRCHSSSIWPLPCRSCVVSALSLSRCQCFISLSRVSWALGSVHGSNQQSFWPQGIPEHPPVNLSSWYGGFTTAGGGAFSWTISCTVHILTPKCNKIYGFKICSRFEHMKNYLHTTVYLMYQANCLCWFEIPSLMAISSKLDIIQIQSVILFPIRLLPYSQTPLNNWHSRD